MNEIYHELMLIDTIQDKGIDDSFRIIGLLIDLALDFQEVDGLEKAFRFITELQGRTLSASQQSLLNYFCANAWSNRRILKSQATDDQWIWEQKEYEQEIIHLRLALTSEGFIQLSVNRQCQILTNLANILDHVGRSVEAIQYWDQALQRIPDFAMAQGNKGIGLYHCAYSHYQRHDNIQLIGQSYALLQRTLASTPLEPSARHRFEYYLEKVSDWKIHEDLLNHQFEEFTSLGETDLEVEYRRWCLKQRLFLNILNDIEETANAAQDTLILPSIVTQLTDSDIQTHGLFNQLKQEFVAARFLYFEALTSDEVHYSDRHVRLYNTLDYPCYSLAVEKVKIAYRMAYSLFDKIAFFLNSYLRLEIPEIQVNFRTCWYKQQQQKKGLREEFAVRQNWPLRGLFWLSKDLFENNPDFTKAIEPHAKELNTIRNHLEHKYLKVHEFGVLIGSGDNAFDDRLAYSIGRSSLEARTLQILKMARSALIYLCMVVQWEERYHKNKATGHGKDEYFTVHIGDFNDDWKI